jgi:predicted DNA-binding transcriptional regulator AlpA
VKMNVEGAPVPAILEGTGISKSTLYEKFDK